MEKSKHLHPSPEPDTAYFILTKLIDEILSTWETHVRRELGSAANLLRPALRDGLSRFLILLRDALTEKESRGMLGEGSELIKQHAGERARQTSFSPVEMVRELQTLRDIVTASLESELALSDQDYSTIQKTFDQAIQESLMEYFLVHAQIKEQFTATLTHDMRNPLAAAKLAADLINSYCRKIEDKDLRGSISHLSDRIISSLDRIDQMIQDLLNTSILELGEKLPAQISECDLLTLVREVVFELEAYDKSRIKVIGTPTVGYWDHNGLKRAIENLIANAIKYGDTDSEITVKIKRIKREVSLSVHNYGNPISKANQKLIFGSYKRTKSAKASGKLGWGLGLAMVRTVSESLGGNAEVSSSREEGTTFTINLPVDSRLFAEELRKAH